MINPDNVYKHLIENVFYNGTEKPTRTGIKTKSLACQEAIYDLRWNKIPLLTTKGMSLNAVRGELDWYLSGETNLKPLIDKGITYWNDWAINKVEGIDGRLVDGELPEIYQSQWRHWQDTRLIHADEVERFKSLGYEILSETTNGRWVAHREIDQIKNLVEGLQKDPYSRRHVLSAWNPGVLDRVALPPCHLMAIWTVNDVNLDSCTHWEQINYYLMYQLNITPFSTEGIAAATRVARDEMGTAALNLFLQKTPTVQELSCTLVMRSNDLALGHPYNIAHYGLLTQLLAYSAGMTANILQVVMTDAHLYENQEEGITQHLDQIQYMSHHDIQSPPATVGFDGVNSTMDLREMLANVTFNYHHAGPVVRFPRAAV